jgi:hypothetical protein
VTGRAHQRWLAAAAVLLALVGCATPPAPLYSWESFPRQQYEILLREGASPLDQIAAMSAHAEKARANSASLPPGFRAHLGMLHLSTGNADAARDFWMAEKAAFPESAPYMDALVKKLEGSAQPAAKENPA